jgi:hypothetical protein
VARKQEVEYLFPPVTYIQIQGEEYLEVTKGGPVRVFPVRANVNQLAMTCEQIVGQKKGLHIQSFEHAVRELHRALLEQDDAFDARVEKDVTAKFEFLGYGPKQLADGILEECNKQLEEHRQLAPSRFLDDDLFQALTHEMLSAVRMGSPSSSSN